MKIFFSLVFFLVFLFSCSNKTSDKILASVYDYELFYDDVIYSLPKNISDTNAFLQKYVDDWKFVKFTRARYALTNEIAVVDSDC